MAAEASVSDGIQIHSYPEGGDVICSPVLLV